MEGSPVLDLGYARLDIDRESRQGVAEVVYAPGKTAEQITGIVAALLQHNSGPVLVTRIGPALAEAVLREVPGGGHDAEARLLTWRPAPLRDFAVTVVAAGTADRPVAAEAYAVATSLDWPPAPSTTWAWRVSTGSWRSRTGCTGRTR